LGHPLASPFYPAELEIEHVATTPAPYVTVRDKSGGRAKIPCEDEEFFL